VLPMTTSVDVAAGVDTLERARLLLAAGRYPDALAFAQQSMASRPGDPDPLIVAAWAENGLRRFDEAESAARAAISASPSLPEAHRVLVAVLTNRAYATRGLARGRRGRQAISAANVLVGLAPNSASSYLTMIDACVAAQEPRKAVAASDIALRMAPSSAHTWLLRARAARCAYDFQVAESAIREALRLEPDNYLANNELGMILRLRGRTTEALQQFQSTASMDPVARPARANLLKYGAIPFQVLILLITSPALLLIHQFSTVWIWGSIGINAFLWRVEPTKSWLEQRAMTVALWRSRRPMRRSKRKERLVPPNTPVQTYRSRRKVSVLFLLLLALISVVITGAVAQAAPVYVPLCLIIDIPTCAFVWWVCKRLRPRPTSPT
jgi:tetratricopeptide (TPR) repeat protein